jgi:3-dehydroquinate synthase
METGSSFGACEKCSSEDVRHVWERVTVPLDEKTYDILIGPGLLTEVVEDIKSLGEFSGYFIVTDDNVADLLGHDLEAMFETAGLSVSMLTFPSGEQSKNINVIEELARKMVRAGADRKSLVIALGGGVAGDMAAFLASIYMRGVPFVQVPTTLLAQVDSSVGGKTGVDLPEGKNLLGTFYQPLRVYADIGALAVLPASEYRNGLAEVVKYGMIYDREFFEWLEDNVSSVQYLEPEAVAHIVKVSCAIKADVVARDEREGGLRRILNFGHTIGHAIEAAAGYGLPHGEAVAIGMVAIGNMSVQKGLMEPSEVMRLKGLLERLGLPVKLEMDIECDTIMACMKSDKKSVKGKISFVLGKGIGDTLITEDVHDDEIIAAVNSVLKR